MLITAISSRARWLLGRVAGCGSLSGSLFADLPVLLYSRRTGSIVLEASKSVCAEPWYMDCEWLRPGPGSIMGPLLAPSRCLSRIAWLCDLRVAANDDVV